MSNILFPLFNRACTDSLGKPRNGYTLTFVGGVPRVDSVGEFLHKNPVTTDSRGEHKPIWLESSSSYDVTIKDSSGATLQTFSNIPGSALVDTSDGILRDGNIILPTSGTNDLILDLIFYTEYSDGDIFHLVPLVNNTGNVTINVNSLGAVPVLSPTGDQLAADKLVAGVPFFVIYYGGNYYVLNASSTSSDAKVITGISGLYGANNTSTPTTKIDITFSWAILSRGSATYSRERISGTTLTADLGLAGPIINGRDQAGAFTASTTIYAYLIYNPTTDTVASILSASGTAPTLPSGYTYYGLVTAWRLNASTQFINGWFRGKNQHFEPIKILDSGNATVETQFDTMSSTAVAHAVYFYYVVIVVPNLSVSIAFRNKSAASCYQSVSENGNNNIKSDVVCMNSGGGTMYYVSAIASGYLNIYLQGYRVNNSAVN